MNETEKIINDIQQGNVDINFFRRLLDRLIDYLPTLLVALVLFAVGLIIDKIMMKLVRKALEKSKLDRTVHGFLRSVVHIGIMIFTVIITLSTLGIPMTSIIAVLSAAGLAIGLALQGSLSNVAGGFIILLSKPFRSGDYIKVGDTEGEVREISIISTQIITIDNKSVFIPNGALSGSTVINFTREPLRRVDITFPVAYEEDFRRAENVIGKVAAGHELILDIPAPQIRVIGLGESSVNIVARVWVKTPDYWTVFFDLNEQVKQAFDSEGIKIPYTQIEVHNGRETIK